MKKETYSTIIEKLTNPDTLADGLVDLNAQLVADEADYNKLVDSNNNLRDTNSKLALRITQPVEPQKTNEPEEVDTWDSFVDKLKTELI